MEAEEAWADCSRVLCFNRSGWLIWRRQKQKVMNYLMGCPMWVWAIVGILLIEVLIVVIAKLLRK